MRMRSGNLHWSPIETRAMNSWFSERGYGPKSGMSVCTSVYREQSHRRDSLHVGLTVLSFNPHCPSQLYWTASWGPVLKTSLFWLLPSPSHLHISSSRTPTGIQGNRGNLSCVSCYFIQIFLKDIRPIQSVLKKAEFEFHQQSLSHIINIVMFIAMCLQKDNCLHLLP